MKDGILLDVKARPGKVYGFSLAEILIGMGMLAVLLLTILLLTASALQGDQKVEARNIGAEVCQSQLEFLQRSVSDPADPLREEFWTTANGAFVPNGQAVTVSSGGTEFAVNFTVLTLQGSSGGPVGGDGNRLRQVEATATWWNGEKGKPGYGQLLVRRTLLFRESDVFIK